VQLRSAESIQDDVTSAEWSHEGRTALEEVAAEYISRCNGATTSTIIDVQVPCGLTRAELMTPCTEMIEDGLAADDSEIVMDLHTYEETFCSDEVEIECGNSSRSTTEYPLVIDCDGGDSDERDHEDAEDDASSERSAASGPHTNTARCANRSSLRTGGLSVAGDEADSAVTENQIPICQGDWNASFGPSLILITADHCYAGVVA
jgi:hypothetical protein